MLFIRAPRLLVMTLLLTTASAQEPTTLDLVHHAAGKEVARSQLVIGKGRLEGRVKADVLHIEGEVETDVNGWVVTYRRTARRGEKGPLHSRIQLTLRDDGVGYRMREEGPLGAATRTVGNGRVHLVLDALWAECVIPILLDRDGGRLTALDTGSGSVAAVSLEPREGGARYLDVPGGGLTLLTDKEGGFLQLRVPGVEAVVITPSGATPASEKPALAPTSGEPVTLPSPIERGGIVTRPSQGSGPWPAVLLLPEGDAKDRDGTPSEGGVGLLRSLATDLTEAGFVTLRYDPPDLGETGLGLAGMKAEIRAALAYLRSREDVAGDRLAIAGHGQGGFLAAETLGEAGVAEGVRALALLAPPARSLRETLVARLRARLGSDPAVSQTALAAAEADLQESLDRVRDLGPDADPGPGARLLRDLLPLVPSDTYMREGLPPTLVVYGESDREIPAAFRGMLGSAISLQGKGRVRMQTVFSADHQFLETDAGPERDDVARRRHPALAEYVRRFLEANLR